MRKLLYAVLVILALLHQDFWNWDRAHLYFGFLPSGLAYHAAYTLVVVFFWILVVRFAWPHEVERFVEEGEAAEDSAGGRR